MECRCGMPSQHTWGELNAGRVQRMRAVRRTPMPLPAVPLATSATANDAVFAMRSSLVVPVACDAASAPAVAFADRSLAPV